MNIQLVMIGVSIGLVVLMIAMIKTSISFIKETRVLKKELKEYTEAKQAAISLSENEIRVLHEYCIVDVNEINKINFEHIYRRHISKNKAAKNESEHIRYTDFNALSLT